jgi:hypothetical protein
VAIGKIVTFGPQWSPLWPRRLKNDPARRRIVG